jgi:transcription elongation factor GreB
VSKAFTSEETPDDEIVVPPRAPLPPGAPNWVTPRGLGLLRSELGELEAERTRLQDQPTEESERPRRLAVLRARIAELSARLANAQLVPYPDRAPQAVRFGTTVTLRTTSGPRAGEERRFQIVGVDEAAPDDGRVAFTSPIARAILGRSVGEEATLRLPRGEESLEIVDVGSVPDRSS